MENHWYTYFYSDNDKDELKIVISFNNLTKCQNDPSINYSVLMTLTCNNASNRSLNIDSDQKDFNINDCTNEIRASSLSGKGDLI